MRNKKMFSLILTAAMTLQMLSPIHALATEEDPLRLITIDSADDLIGLENNCHDDSWSVGKTVKLDADIDLTGADFRGIPIFNGKFEGNGHTVSGYTYGGEGYVTGFFRYIGPQGTVRDLNISGTVIATGDQKCTGMLAGINQGLIEKCGVSGSVSGNRETGGLVGINQPGGFIYKCESTVDVSGYYYTGGIAGKNFGRVSYCVNKGNVNNTESWVMGDDEKSEDIIETITDETTAPSMQSGVDTGGIIGYSDGVIDFCRNEGVVGYDHVGYNIGGIAGRTLGLIYSSHNYGFVYGKKDVGGIAGQLEPYIETDKAKSIRSSIERVNDSVVATINTAEAAGEAISDDLEKLSDHSKAALDSADELAKLYSDGTDTGLEAEKLADEAKDTAKDKADESKDKTKDKIKEAQDDPEKAAEEAKDKAKDYYDSARERIENRDGDEIEDLNIRDRDVDADKAKVRSDLTKGSEEWNRNMNAMLDDLDGMADSLSALTKDSDKYSDELNDCIRETDNRVTATYDLISDLVGGVREEGVKYLFTDISESELLSLDDPHKTLRDSNGGVIMDCSNRNSVKCDLQGGGIVGSLAVDDENLENNAILSFALTAGESYTTSGMIVTCKNLALVSVKNNYAGGIVGKMDRGIVYRSEGYGPVESIEGDYIGGIAGRSDSVIRKSYVMCTLSGDEELGGIAGYATAVKDCVALPTFGDHTGTSGAIAGQILRDKKTEEMNASDLSGNVFVCDSAYGIDDISYKGVAEATDYASALEIPDIPEAFSDLTVSFRVGDRIVKTVSVKYGQSLEGIETPELEHTDGSYGSWPDLTGRTALGNIMVTAEFIPEITVLSSALEYEENGKPLALISGGFDSDDIFDASFERMAATSITDNNGKTVKIKDALRYRLELTAHEGAIDTENGGILRLYTPYKDCTVYCTPYDAASGISGQAWTAVESEMKGSYVVVDYAENTEYMVVEKPGNTIYIVTGAGCAAAVLVIAIISVKIHGKKKAKHLNKAVKS